METQPDRPAPILKSQYIVAALVVAAIVALGVTGSMWAHKGVTVVVDGESRFVKTQAATVGDFLGEEGIVLGEGDLVTPACDACIEDATTVIVRHAVPVTVSVAGQPVEIDVIGSTVADALIAAGLDVDGGVQCVPSLASPIEPGMSIAVNDVVARVIRQESEVAYETTTTDDPTIPKGTRAVLTEGSPGKMLSVYRVLVVGGVETSRTLVAQRVTAEPVAEVIGMGTGRSGGRTLASRSKFKAPVSGKTLTVTATGYAPNVDGVGTRTATGDTAGFGIIAVDPRVIPLGTKLWVPGYGYGVAADTGGAIKGDRIDLCYDTGREAIDWGRRTVTITIVQ
jgi:uncharacterized protein YabE (DUF348 family)